MSSSRRLAPLPVAIALAVGIAAAPFLDRAGIDPAVRWAITAAVCLLAPRHRAFLVAALVCAGAARGAAPVSTLPSGVIVDDRGLDRLVGVVGGPVVRTDHGVGATLDVDGTEVWLWSETPVQPGEQIAVTGLLRTARGWRDPGVPERAGLELSVRTIEHLADAPGLRDRAWRWAAETQRAWAEGVDEAGGDPVGRAALRGIAVGDRTAVPPSLDDRWRATGIFHVLSVSGLHLAVVAGLVFALLRRLVAASPWGGRVRPARWAAPPAIVLAIAYTLITGAQLATVRSLIVVVVVLIAAMLDRPIRLLDALGLAAVAILAWHPADLFDPSFQLSFTAALTLALRPPSEQRGVRGWIVRGIAASLWITLTTAPITAYQFQQVAPGGIVGNLVLTPIVELVALPMALAGIALGALGAPLVHLATWIVTEVDRGAGLLAYVTPVGRIPMTSGVLAAIVVAISVWLAARASRTRLDVVVWIALCLAWTLARTPPPLGALRVTFLDVGQGDAALIELPDGAVWLVDAGGIASAQELAAATAPGATVARVLAGYGHDRIDLAILSHPHPDHYLGLAALAALDVPITELWTAAELEPAPAAGARSFAEISAELVARGTRIVHPPLGIVRREAGVELAVWGPRYHATADAPAIETADPVRSVNDNSLVIEIRYRGRSILFVGDVEREGEELAVDAGVAHVDVVKVGHHGSPTSSSPGFVAATHPALAVISCGRANTFGFPSPAVVERWEAVGAEVARTDRDGAITVVVDITGALRVDRFAPAVP